MIRTRAAALFVVAALALPAGARANEMAKKAAAKAAAAAKAGHWEIRLGLELPVLNHVNNVGNTTLLDSLKPAVNAIVARTFLYDVVGVGLEGRYGFLATNNAQASGLAAGPALMLNVWKFFLRASLPIHITPSPLSLNARGAFGLRFMGTHFGVYLEGTAEAPLFGGGDIKPFRSQEFGGGAGIQLRF